MKNLFSIKNKVFIITGVSSGIGKYLANSILDLGGIVYGITRKKEKESVPARKNNKVQHASD